MRKPRNGRYSVTNKPSLRASQISTQPHLVPWLRTCEDLGGGGGCQWYLQIPFSVFCNVFMDHPTVFRRITVRQRGVFCVVWPPQTQLHIYFRFIMFVAYLTTVSGTIEWRMHGSILWIGKIVQGRCRRLV
jgi:hypothetical protein